MARLSDIIEDFIKEMLQETHESELQIQRNELANQFSCAPSQINYVLTTRFTLDKGYYIESKRGGGGYIVIKRVEHTNDNSLIELINDRIGDNITYDNAVLIIDGLKESGLITQRESEIMKIAVNNRVLGSIEDKNKIRSEILKAMLLVVIG
ncbi:MAG: CtsR family transcriptional regulator [Bacillota bacterium]|nr:CtsR family transcriptional regulator [Bacillota bacterium]